MKNYICVLIIFVIAVFPLTILYGQNSIETPSNLSSNTSTIFKFTNITEISYGFGIGSGIKGSHGHASFGIRTINGLLFNSKLSLGIGIGLDRLRISENLGQTILPVSVDIRYYFLKYPKILFFGVEGGYTYNLSGYKLNYESGLGGYFVNPSFGTKVLISKKVSLIINLGIKIQKNTIQYVWTPLPVNEMLLNIKTGLLF